MNELGETRVTGPEAYKKREKQITLEIKVGEHIEDKDKEQFFLEEKLGEGAMGWVFKARSERNGMVQAIKFMNSRMRGSTSAVKRFEREIRVLGQLNNPFILVAHDVRKFVINGEEITGLVTEFVEGPSLSDELDEKGAFEPTRLATLAAQLAFALESLRKEGIVHRDLKPSNIFLHEMPDGEQFVRIGDFGIAGFAFEDEREQRMDDPSPFESRERLTKDGFTVGTPQFMAPEAYKWNPKVDHRSDLYSLGVVMYKMAAGQSPFSGSTEEVFTQHAQTLPPDFSSMGIDTIPSWLEEIIMRLLKKDPDDRYQSAAELFQALKKGVAKQYPEFLNDIPFIWDLKLLTYDDAPTAIAA